MSDLDTALKLVKDIDAKKLAGKLLKDAIIQKFENEKRVKPLTDKQRIDRIEEILGVK